MGPVIHIKLQLGEWPADQDQCVAIPLDQFVFREGLAAIDFPTDDAPVMVKAFICTPPDQIKRVIRDRQELADYLSRRVTRLILDRLGAADMLMGYPKEAARAAG